MIMKLKEEARAQGGCRASGKKRLQTATTDNNVFQEGIREWLLPVISEYFVYPSAI
jgi:hypothetical protein